jgi:hypothetical protein
VSIAGSQSATAISNWSPTENKRPAMGVTDDRCDIDSLFETPGSDISKIANQSDSSLDDATDFANTFVLWRSVSEFSSD